MCAARLQCMKKRAAPADPSSSVVVEKDDEEEESEKMKTAGVGVKCVAPPPLRATTRADWDASQATSGRLPDRPMDVHFHFAHHVSLPAGLCRGPPGRLDVMITTVVTPTDRYNKWLLWDYWSHQ